MISEHNAIAPAHEHIDNDTKLSKLKDVLENITEFQVLEDNIALNLSGLTLSSDQLLELYETRAMQIDNHFTQSNKKKSFLSAIRTAPIHANVADTSFEDDAVNVSTQYG